MPSYADRVLQSVEWWEEQASVLNAQEFEPVLGTPRQIVAEQFPDPNKASRESHRRSRGSTPRDEVTKVDLPRGYYDARIARGPRPRY